MTTLLGGDKVVVVSHAAPENEWFALAALGVEEVSMKRGATWTHQTGLTTDLIRILFDASSPSLWFRLLGLDF